MIHLIESNCVFILPNRHCMRDQFFYLSDFALSLTHCYFMSFFFDSFLVIFKFIFDSLWQSMHPILDSVDEFFLYHSVDRFLPIS